MRKCEGKMMKLEENKYYSIPQSGFVKDLMKRFDFLTFEDFDSHNSDLYIKYYPEVDNWLKKNYVYYSNIDKFRSNIDKTLWLDIPFVLLRGGEMYPENKNKEKTMSKETIDKIKSLKEKGKKTEQKTEKAEPKKSDFVKSEAISRDTFKTYYKQIAETKGKKPESKDLKEGFVQSPTNHYKKSNKLDILLFPGEAKDIMKKVEELMSQNKNTDAIKPMLHRAKSSLTEILDTAYKAKDYTSTKVTEAIEFIKQVDSMLDGKKPIAEKKVEVKEESKKVIAENKQAPVVPKSQKLQDLDAKLDQIGPKKITLDDVR